MSQLTHNTLFGWSVVVAIAAVAFFLGALNMKVDGQGRDIAFIKQMFVNSRVIVMRR